MLDLWLHGRLVSSSPFLRAHVDGRRLRREDIEVVAGSGAVPFNRTWFGGHAVDVEPKAGKPLLPSRGKRN